MQVDKWVREQMLLTLEDKIDDSFVASKGYVEFFDSGGTALCSLEFDDMEIQSTGTDNAILLFKSTDGSDTLKGTVSVAGEVVSFKIKGTNDDPANDYVIIGTVGPLNSSADLQFNVTQWQNGTYVTIEDFSIELPNGS